jgi:hypothetical protein
MTKDMMLAKTVCHNASAPCACMYRSVLYCVPAKNSVVLAMQKSRTYSNTMHIVLPDSVTVCNLLYVYTLGPSATAHNISAISPLIKIRKPLNCYPVHVT